MHPYKKMKQKKVNWKSGSFLTVSTLLVIILVIPTLVVVLTGTDSDETASLVEQQSEIDEISFNAADSAFSVQVTRSKTDQTETVLLEDYVTRVVASEMPAEFEEEALKAQALAARTYIVNYLAQTQSDGKELHVKDTVQHQVYKNDEELREVWGSDYNWKMKKIQQAVAATVGQILTYNDQPITPAFFSTSNGYTENSEDYWQNALPYLTSVASPWDEDSPKFLDQKIIPIKEVESKLGVLIPDNTTFPVTKTESNRIKTVEIAGKTFTGRDVRQKLDLRSSDFEIEQKSDHIIFTTKGYGHGIGMSQYGANGMAEEGKNYQEIVTYYYQGVEIDTIQDTTPTLVARN
ncbi:stage II sporulation protein D [Paraliobacillus quinghaiensis]|uniref:Stage II sporulation protein D n=1 Tax=Paraliobacillus quinghaiensis TaxID=470815 RepID=A0A917WV06_9BACI|nr:stage II sporulation protein D [Paraliobacillus quinghaiensis]GGM32480.1 stage II sporulation protein D [Paraliobacillus quinghaiensis]